MNIRDIVFLVFYFFSILTYVDYEITEVKYPYDRIFIGDNISPTSVYCYMIALIGLIIGFVFMLTAKWFGYYVNDNLLTYIVLAIISFLPYRAIVWFAKRKLVG